jgi:hypothetical protein
MGEVVELGSSYGAHSKGRPELYATLKVGDKVLSSSERLGNSPIKLHFR